MSSAVGTRGRSLSSGWALRISLAIACALLGVVTLTSGVGVGMWTLVGIAVVGLGVGTVLRPESIAPSLLLLIAMTMRLVAGEPVIDWRLVCLVVLLPTVQVLAGVAAAVPLRATIAPRVLRPALVRWSMTVSLVVLLVGLARIFGWLG